MFGMIRFGFFAASIMFFLFFLPYFALAGNWSDGFVIQHVLVWRCGAVVTFYGFPLR
jgi:hypothetical protein